MNASAKYQELNESTKCHGRKSSLLTMHQSAQLRCIGRSYIGCLMSHWHITNSRVLDISTTTSLSSVHVRDSQSSFAVQVVQISRTLEFVNKKWMSLLRMKSQKNVRRSTNRRRIMNSWGWFDKWFSDFGSCSWRTHLGRRIIWVIRRVCDI